jgi:peptide chain release factor
MSVFREIWIQITSGQGPAECERAVSRVFDKMTEDAVAKGLNICVLEKVAGQVNESYQSILLSVKGDEIDVFTHKWQGTIQWICVSPYRSLHKRKNWYVGVNVLEVPRAFGDIDPKQLRFSTMRASGAGGQQLIPRTVQFV